MASLANLSPLKPLQTFARGQRTKGSSSPLIALHLSSTRRSHVPLLSVRTYGARQCTAKSKRSGRRCLNPAAYGCKTCRMHGARKYTAIRRGSDHPNFRHGNETLSAKAQRSRALGRLRQLEDLMHLLEMTTAGRTVGRKPVTESN